jgi:hypothetical protein
MKVLAVKGVEEFSNLWAVRYTRLTRRGVKQDAYFMYETQGEALKKRYELLDIVKRHNGEYISVKAKKKLKTSRRKPAR